MATGGMHGAIEPFNGKNWSSWIQRLTFYFVANDVSNEEKKRALLLTLCGADTFETACALVAPKTPGEVSYTDMVTLLQKHFDPRPSELYSRYVFQRRDQLPGESISNYVAALRSLSADCNFGVPTTTSATSTLPAEGHSAVQPNPTMLPQDVMLRDRFVCGIRDEHLQQRLFAEKDLTFQRALDLALSSESASKQQRGLKGATNSGEVHKTSHSKKEGKTSPQQRRCYRCDGWHEADTCKFRTAQCRFCAKKGHIENACLTKKRKIKEGNLNTRQETRTVNAQSTSYDPVSSDRCYDLHAVSGRQPCPKFLVDVKVEGRPLKFEVDTGAACSLISEATYHQTWPSNAPKLLREPLDLRTWSGEELRTLGSAQVRVRFKSKDYVLPLLIMKGTGCNLLGRDWFSALNIRVHGIHQAADPRQEIQDVLARHPDVFKEDIDGYVGPLVHLDLEEGATARFCKARPVPLAYQEPMEDELDRLQKQGILEPTQHAEMATPLVWVRKRDGTFRVCGDYRSTVNAVVKKTAYPLPTTAEVFAKLRGGTTFSTLDLYQAYQQLRVDDETAALLTVNTTKGLFKVKRLPFGISAAPAIFQRMMETTLAGIQGVSVYLDDIIVSGNNVKEHAQRLDEVLSRLSEKGLRLKQEKCRFGISSVEFLGHKIDAQGVHTTEEKVKAILEAPKPTDKTSLQAFLGLLAFYDRFLENRATVAAELYKLLEKNTPWKWEQKHQAAFEALKKMIKSSTVLAHYDEKKPLILSVDASPYGIGAVLAQKDASGREAPIAFASRTLGSAEKNYSQLDKEGLAVVYGVSHFHQYVAGRHVTVMTDHQPLLGIMGEKKQIPQILSPRMTRWCLKLATYDYNLVYRPGRLHQNADALSRLPLPAQVDEPCSPGDVLMLASAPRLELSPQQLAEMTRSDPLLSRVMRAVSSGELRRLPKQEFLAFTKLGNELSLQEGCVIRGTRLVVPEKARKDVLELAHAGHRGVVAMKACARGYFWWPGVDNDIERVVKSCTTCCQHQKAPNKAPPPDWKRATTPWHTIHADFAGPVEGKMLLIVVDAYSKWLEVRYMRNIQSPTLIEELRNLFATFGIPERLVTDNGPSFVSAEMEDFLKKNRVTHVTSAPYHPATNGQAERMVLETKQALAKDQSGTFACRLARFLLKQHTTVSVTTGRTPAALMFGRELTTALTRIQPRPAERAITDHSVTNSPRKVAVGQTVFFRNFSGSPAWIGGTVLKRLGYRSWLIKSGSGTVRRHLDHIKPGAEAYPTEGSPPSDQANGPADSEQPCTVPAPYVIALPAETSPSRDLPTTPSSEQGQAEARLDSCATQPCGDQDRGSPQHHTAPRPKRDRRPPDRYGDPF